MGANTSANATAPSVGMNVVDNTGAALGTVSEVSTVQGQQVATVNMDGRRFSVPVGALAVANGRATINLTRAQIEAQLPAASSNSNAANTPSRSTGDAATPSRSTGDNATPSRSTGDNATPSRNSSSTSSTTRSTTSSSHRGH
jgi:hypothetical protein